MICFFIFGWKSGFLKSVFDLFSFFVTVVITWLLYPTVAGWLIKTPLYEKINKFGVERYYILSGVEQKQDDVEKNAQLTFEIQQEHGCQLIINGLYPSLKYYLRLIATPKEFLDKYTELVENDTELQPVHKERLQELIDEYFG